jgi:glycosyltransferase involved in cell wall biosynthesis
LDKEFLVDFYFGDKIGLPIKKMNYNELSGFKREVKNILLFGNFYWQKDMIKLIFRSYDAFLITGEPYCISNWVILIISKFLRKKTVLWSHGWYGNESIIKKIIKKIFFNLSNTVLLNGNYARDLMIKQGIDANKLIVIFNSLDYQKQIEIRSKLNETDIYKSYFSNENPVIIYIGRIQKNKKIDLLLRAVYQLKTESKDCNLVIIGNEVEEINIQDIIADNNMGEYVWLYGSCYEEKILGELLFNADVCVVPGDIGLTVMHSYVYGTPVITHDNFPKHGPEFEAIIDGVTGCFFVENSLDDLCTKISNWTRISIDERENVRRKCYEIIDEKYNPDTQISILKKVLA